MKQKHNTMNSNKRCIGYAVILHVFIFALLITTWDVTTYHYQASNHLPSIQARALTQIPPDKAQIEAKKHALAVLQAKRRQAAKAQALAQQRKLAAIAKAKARAVQLAYKKHQLLAQRILQLQQQQIKQLKLDKQHVLEQQKIQLTKKMAQDQLQAEQQRLQQMQHEAQLQVIDHYKNQILSLVGQMWLIPRGASADLSCQLNINLAPDGSVLKVTIAKSSGDPSLDQSAISAVYQASPLPVPHNPALFSQFQQLRLTLRPEKIVRL